MENNFGIVNLRNTKKYPFNDSETTVALNNAFSDTDYRVYTEVVSCVGEVGDVVVSGKARNGFKIAYTGSAAKAEIRWIAEVL